ncbi:unnamed protein product [Aphanomyces euteiches]
MKLPALTTALFLLSAQRGVVLGAKLCSALEPYSYTSAKSQHADLKDAIDALQGNAIASWYTDRGTSPVTDLLSKCQDAIPAIVIYGLPNKDCGAGGFSSDGDNKNADMYKAWIQKLVDQVGQKEVIYVLEPDAIGLISNGGCGVSNGYQNNLKIAVALLSTNANAHIYADVASWAKQEVAAGVLNDLKQAGRLAGVAINTSNYRGSSELNSLCQSYSSATGGLHCVIDTARNYNGSPQSEWCNARSAGIGSPPTDQTGNPLVDYHLWIKVPGESDGQCTGQSSDAMIGPSAGAFFYDGFKTLWNQGYYVKEKGLPQIGANQPWPSSSAPPSYPSSAPPSPPSNNPTPAPSNGGGAAQAWAQCGGNGYNGPTGCTNGFTCKYNNEWYSQCLPNGGNYQATQVESSSVSETVHKVPAWQHCGGGHYQGPTTCVEGYECKATDGKYMSQCVESTSQVQSALRGSTKSSSQSKSVESVGSTQVAGPWQECGGDNYSGPTTCAQGYQCQQVHGQSISQCIATKSSTVSKSKVASKSKVSSVASRGVESKAKATAKVVQVAAWQQCGGLNYHGPTACVTGYACQETDKDFSQCVIVKARTNDSKASKSLSSSSLSKGFDVQLVAAWQQCGGKAYYGPTSCVEGYECKETDVGFSQCVQVTKEKAPAVKSSSVHLVPAWQQCGGPNYFGPTGCVQGYVCKETDNNFSQCVETS